MFRELKEPKEFELGLMEITVFDETNCTEEKMTWPRSATNERYNTLLEEYTKLYNLLNDIKRLEKSLK